MLRCLGLKPIAMAFGVAILCTGAIQGITLRIVRARTAGAVAGARNRGKCCDGAEVAGGIAVRRPLRGA